MLEGRSRDCVAYAGVGGSVVFLLSTQSQCTPTGTNTISPLPKFSDFSYESLSVSVHLEILILISLVLVASSFCTMDPLKSKTRSTNTIAPQHLATEPNNPWEWDYKVLGRQRPVRHAGQ